MEQCSSFFFFFFFKKNKSNVNPWGTSSLDLFNPLALVSISLMEITHADMHHNSDYEWNNNNNNNNNNKI